MYANPKKSSESKATTTTQKKQSDSSTRIYDLRPEHTIQRKLQSEANQSPQVQANQTGLPDQLKASIEGLSGHSLDDVKVHYNSAKPAQLQAHAYAQGSQIHLASGQERHLPHEAWHVVQQKQGRVRPTKQMKGGVAINDDAGLEREADVMGARALQLKSTGRLQTEPDTITKAALHTSQLRSAVIQRTITVDHIDYDPVAGAYRDGIIEVDPFFDALRVSLWAMAAFNGFRAQWQNVRGVVSLMNFNNPDIPQLATAIRAAIVAEYGNRGLVIAGGLLAGMTAPITTALTTNIRADHQMAMDAGEQNVFDALIAAAGVAASRAKGAPTQVAQNQLNGGTNGQVNARLAEIAAERARWNIAMTNAEYKNYFFSSVDQFAPEIIGRQNGIRYQGNHTNLAGWLPAVAVPVDVVPAARAAIRAAMSNRLKRVLRDPAWSDRLGFTGPHAARPNPLGAEFNALVAAHVTPIGTPALQQSAIDALCQGVSAYIEFSMGGGFSRFVYDPVNDRKYITAHYKWRDGYNPFFRVN
ncbi:MAG: DUF4157 domain-containing protein [Reichenbachiella sp.]|uniref:eCIS core domain-containing protein n=1 Tax=Reichenbachiella sp. TaxID=2184521 RepID=UPI003267D2F5